MTEFEGPDPNQLAADMPPGTAPAFGHLPELPVEATPEHLVLSSVAHSRLAERQGLAHLNGHFSHERFGHGSLAVRATGLPGEVHIHADVLTLDGPTVHLDADVRESWLERTAHSEDSSLSSVQVVRELFRLAEIPRQSIVRVRIDAD